MRADGVKRALAFVTSAYSSYSGCRQYRGNIADGQNAVGPGAPAVDKIRAFYNHPGFIGPMAERVEDWNRIFATTSGSFAKKAFEMPSLRRSDSSPITWK